MNFTEEQAAIFDKAIQIFGVDHQVNLAMEECNEFGQAVNKLRRLGGIKFGKIIPPNKDSSVEYCLAYFNLCSEVADVKIMMAQMGKMLGLVGAQAIKESENRKISRLEETLKKKVTPVVYEMAMVISRAIARLKGFR